MASVKRIGRVVWRFGDFREKEKIKIDEMVYGEGWSDGAWVSV